MNKKKVAIWKSFISLTVWSDFPVPNEMHFRCQQGHYFQEFKSTNGGISWQTFKTLPKLNLWANPSKSVYHFFSHAHQMASCQWLDRKWCARNGHIFFFANILSIYCLMCIFQLLIPSGFENFQSHTSRFVLANQSSLK